MGTEMPKMSHPKGQTPLGVPVEVDLELTPGPQEPPQVVPRNVSPELQAHLQMITDRLTEVTQAVNQVWPARKDGDRLDRIDSKLGTLAEYATKHQTMLHEFVVPVIKECMAATDGIAIQLPKVIAQIEGISIMLGNVDRRLRELEGQLVVANERFNSKALAIETRVGNSENLLRDLDERLEMVERRERDREVVSKALAKTERKKSGAIGASLGAVAAVVTQLISKYL